MVLTKEMIATELEKKKQVAVRDKSRVLQEIDELKAQKENAEYELSVVRDRLNAVNEALYDKNADLKLKKGAFESANRAIYNDLASAEGQVSSMMAQIDTVKAKKHELDKEVCNLVQDMADRLSIYRASISSTITDWQKTTSRTVKINDKMGLETLLQLNPNVLLVIEDSNNEIHIVDNRNTRVTLVNDSINTEKEGSVHPFRFIKPLKPITSNRGNTITTMDSLSETLSSYTRWAEQIPNGVTVEPSYGGIHLQVHKVGPNVTIWDDNRTNLTDNLPSIVSAANLVPHDFVVDGYLEVPSGNQSLKRSELRGMIINNDHILEQKSQFIVTDILWMDNADLHLDSLEARRGKLNIFNGRYKNIVMGKQTKVYNKQDCMECISQMCRTPNATGAIMKHPDHTYGLGGTTTMAVEFAAKKTLNVKILYSTTVSPEGRGYIYDCGVIDDNGNDVYVGKTDVTTISPDVQALKVEFKSIHEFLDTSTDQTHFNMIGAMVLDSVELDEVSTIQEARAFADMDETPLRYRAQPTMGVMFTDPELTPIEEIEIDCACNKRKALPEDPQIDAEFKIKEQIYTTVTDGVTHSKPVYHLLIQLPSKVLDFVSTMNPINQHPCNMDRSIATKMHWEVAGELSPRHKLNDGKNQRSIVTTVDQGPAKISTQGDINYDMSIYLKGDYIDGLFDLKRLAKHRDTWTLNMAGMN